MKGQRLRDPDLLLFSQTCPPAENQCPEVAQTLGVHEVYLNRDPAGGNQMVFAVGKRQTVRTATPAWCQVTVRLNKQPQRLFLHPDRPLVIDNLGSAKLLAAELDPNHDSNFNPEGFLKLFQHLGSDTKIPRCEGKHLSRETFKTR